MRRGVAAWPPRILAQAAEEQLDPRLLRTRDLDAFVRQSMSAGGTTADATA